MEYQKPYAGTLQYVPRLAVSGEIIQRLKNKLVANSLVQGPENAFSVIDWYGVERDANRTPVRQSYVLLLRVGEDSGLPACIFYRQEIDRQAKTTLELCHIPPREQQAGLCAAWKWWEDPTGQKLAILNNYLDQAAGKPEAWQTL